jgi:hypothetical protein
MFLYPFSSTGADGIYSTNYSRADLLATFKPGDFARIRPIHLDANGTIMIGSVVMENVAVFFAEM